MGMWTHIVPWRCYDPSTRTQDISLFPVLGERPHSTAARRPWRTFKGFTGCTNSLFLCLWKTRSQWGCTLHWVSSRHFFITVPVPSGNTTCACQMFTFAQGAGTGYLLSGRLFRSSENKQMSFFFSNWASKIITQKTATILSQLFEMASRRNIKSYIWAFNIQCNMGSKLGHKYFSRAHFSTEIIEAFWGGKKDTSLARNKFLGCLVTLELLEKG